METYKTYFGVLEKITRETPEGPRKEYDLTSGVRVLLMAGLLAGGIALQAYITHRAEREIEAERSMYIFQNSPMPHHLQPF